MKSFIIKNKNPTPFNLAVYKGRKSWKIPRSFVTFLLGHPVALEFVEWCKTVYIPDEHFIPTLARISNITVSITKSAFLSTINFNQVSLLLSTMSFKLLRFGRKIP